MEISPTVDFYDRLFQYCSENYLHALDIFTLILNNDKSCKSHDLRRNMRNLILEFEIWDFEQRKNMKNIWNFREILQEHFENLIHCVLYNNW